MIEVFKSSRKLVPASALVVLALASANTFATTTYDLQSGWSDSTNPNGVWSYNDGDGAITSHVTNWLGGAAGPNAQPAWAATADPVPGHVVSWFKATNDLIDFQVGDIVVHTWDAFNGARTPPANLTWTSPEAGTIDLSGSVWLARDIGRAVDWAISIGGTTVTGGSLFSGDAYSRDNPFSFAAGSGGLAALTGLSVSKGDVVKLALFTSSAAGEFTGVDLQVALNPVPEPSTYGLFAAGLLALSVRRGAFGRR